MGQSFLASLTARVTSRAKKQQPRLVKGQCFLAKQELCHIDILEHYCQYHDWPVTTKTLITATPLAG